MKVFVTGATRVLGQPVVRLLIERGDTVRALSRSEDGDRELQALGAEPVRADLFDLASPRAAVGDADAVLHLATRIPPASAMGDPAAWVENDRIRVEGTRNLVDAALATAAEVVVYPSITFIYPDRGDNWTDATTTEPASDAALASTRVAEAEVARFAAAGGRGVSLRMGNFYGPTSSHTQEALAYARQGMAGVIGPDDAYQAMIWVDDAASAIVAAMERAPSGVYDVVDDEPLTKRELVAAIAAGIGDAPLQRIPASAVRAAIGPDMFEIMSRGQRVSNQRFKEVTGWAPSVPNAREGWRILGGAMAAVPARG
ncbi:MAG: NAD-dependent epimerase/dehydratase family protein [Thermomicrobiales bacterium]